MSSARDNGGPAFPAEEWLDSEDPRCVNPVRHLGMTLRDYFAAKAAPALLRLCQQDALEGQDYLSYCAGLSYKMADAMLKARAE